MISHNRARTHKSGFTIVELVGALIIISILTTAGITGISAAVDNSRMTAIYQDLDGFRKAAEQFLMDNPQDSKWNGINSSAQIQESFDKFNTQYLEGSMKLERVVQSRIHSMIRGTTIKRDPYGTAYDVIMVSTKLLHSEDDPLDNSYMRIFIRSQGKNGNQSHVPDSFVCFLGVTDNDDIYSLTQFSDGHIDSTQFMSDTKVFFYDQWGYSKDTQSWGKLPYSNIPNYDPWD
ncbi:MAG: type II secretion system protein [Clostridia bacterium]